MALGLITYKHVMTHGLTLMDSQILQPSESENPVQVPTGVQRVALTLNVFLGSRPRNEHLCTCRVKQ